MDVGTFSPPARSQPLACAPATIVTAQPATVGGRRGLDGTEQNFVVASSALGSQIDPERDEIIVVRNFALRWHALPLRSAVHGSTDIVLVRVKRFPSFVRPG